MKRYQLSQRAYKDLREISAYVSMDSIEAADRLLDAFRRAFEQIAGMPGIGHRRLDLPLRGVRVWAVKPYLVVYRESKPLRVLRIVHGRRDLKKLFNRN